MFHKSFQRQWNSEHHQSLTLLRTLTSYGIGFDVNAFQRISKPRSQDQIEKGVETEDWNLVCLSFPKRDRLPGCSNLQEWKQFFFERRENQVRPTVFRDMCRLWTHQFYIRPVPAFLLLPLRSTTTHVGFHPVETFRTCPSLPLVPGWCQPPIHQIRLRTKRTDLQDRIRTTGSQSTRWIFVRYCFSRTGRMWCSTTQARQLWKLIAVTSWWSSTSGGTPSRRLRSVFDVSAAQRSEDTSSASAVNAASWPGSVPCHFRNCSGNIWFMRASRRKCPWRCRWWKTMKISTEFKSHQIFVILFHTNCLSQGKTFEAVKLQTMTFNYFPIICQQRTTSQMQHRSWKTAKLVEYRSFFKCPWSTVWLKSS